MAQVKDVVHHIRSKNAGPYWVTFDLFFDGEASFEKYAKSPKLGPDTFARIYGADPAHVKSFPVRNLHMVKISYARTSPQGGEIERDMHCGQQYVRLLDLELD